MAFEGIRPTDIPPVHTYQFKSPGTHAKGLTASGPEAGKEYQGYDFKDKKLENKKHRTAGIAERKRDDSCRYKQ